MQEAITGINPEYKFVQEARDTKSEDTSHCVNF
jgi:hypothetical protein